MRAIRKSHWLDQFNKMTTIRLNPIFSRLTLLAGLGILVIQGIYWRWHYLDRMIFDVDEFNSLLGIKMILEKGLPILPSGLLYDRGLLFSYLGAGVAMLTDFQAVNIRWLSLFLGALIILVAYATSSRLFESKLIGVLIALSLAIHPLAITWSARARMYNQAQLFVFAAIFFAWQTLRVTYFVKPAKSAKWYLGLTLFCFSAGLLSHLVTSVILVSLLPAGLGVYWLASHYFKIDETDKSPPQNIIWLMGGLMLIGAVAFIGLQFSFQAQLEQTKAVQDPADAFSVAEAITDLSGNWTRWSEGWDYLVHEHNLIFSIGALIGFGILLVRVFRRQMEPVDYAGLLLYLILAGTLIQIYFIFSDETHSPRHNFIPLLPVLILLFGYGIRTLTRLGQNQIMAPLWSVGPVIVAAGIIIGYFTPKVDDLLFKDQGRTYRYDQGFMYVSEQMAAADKVMSYHAAAGYLYSSHFDYYVYQARTAAIFSHPETGQTVDVYAAAPFIHSVETLQTALDEPGRLWFVIDEKRLYNRYTAEFTQQILQQMTPVHTIDNIIILAEKPDRWALASLPEQAAQLDFSGQLQLAGYTPQQVGQKLYLTLFLQAIAPARDYKVFVHLRDDAGQIIAQADYWPFEQILGARNWPDKWSKTDLIRTGTILHLPDEFTPGPYTLFVGLYSADTLERLPIVNDTSGENAAVLTGVVLQPASSGN